MYERMYIYTHTLVNFSEQKVIRNKLLAPKTEILNHNYDILLKCHPTPQFPPSKKKCEHAYFKMKYSKGIRDPILLDLISTSIKRTLPIKS